MSRPSLDETMLRIAELLALRATCPKLAVGCVLVDKRGRIIGAGYNGVPHGVPHCIDKFCAGAQAAAGSDLCIAVHAEQNAILQVPNVENIWTCYVTHPPCMACTKLLANTGCTRIVMSSIAPFNRAAMHLWHTNPQRSWVVFERPELSETNPLGV